jgi:hypothetical protein
MPRPIFIFALLALTFLGCSNATRLNERKEAMRQMQRDVGMLHSHMRTTSREIGFPKSNNEAKDGTETCSWRVTVLDCCETGPAPHESWKSPLNQGFASQSVGSECFRVTARTQRNDFTQVFGLIGPGTAFTEYEYTKGRESADAEPDAILLLDAQNQLIHWMEPGDIRVESLLYGQDDAPAFGYLLKTAR